MNDTLDPIFDEKNEVKVEYKNIKFGKVGNWFRGTLTDNSRQIPNDQKKGSMQTIFEFKAKGGSLNLIHDRAVDPEATPIQEGEFWSLITDKDQMLQRLRKAQLGQIVGLRFAEEKPPKVKGNNPAKIISVYLGDMDPEYQGETQGD